MSGKKNFFPSDNSSISRNQGDPDPNPGFGELNGPPIDNKDEILSLINVALGKKPDENPCIEYIITQPYGLITLPFGLGSINYNWFGHSALRYRNPDDGRDVVVNVEAKVDGKNFLQMYDAKEYFYGTDPETCGQQKGIYHRDYVTIRIENIDQESLQRMHQHILKLMDQDRKESRFNILLGPVLNALALIYPNFPEYGNCARWTSTMLKEAGLLKKLYVWPKTVLINMFENYEKNKIRTLDNMNIVYYEQPPHVEKLAYGVKAKPVWFEKTVAPMQLVRNRFYGDLKSFAKVVVRVPEGQTHAVVIVRPDEEVSKPNAWRNILNSKYYIMSSVVVSVIIYKKGWDKMKVVINKYRTKTNVTTAAK